MYKYILIDIDDTIQDYLPTERKAIISLLEMNGLENVSPETAEEISRRLDADWCAANMNDISNDYIQKNYHTLYRNIIASTAEKTVTGYCGVTDVSDAYAQFMSCWKNNHTYKSGVQDVLARLSKKYTLAVATNGLCDMQGAKIFGVKQYFDKFYFSESVGFIKPQPEFFGFIMNDLGASPNECLMVGDSLEADIAGANSVGIDACLFSPRSEKPSNVKYKINSFSELEELLASSRQGE